jgi:murein L,D-transpeptidase YafK
MEDSFDHSSSQVKFDVNAFAHQLFKEANPDHLGKVQIHIEETTLTGSSNLAKRTAEQTNWQTLLEKGQTMAQLKQKPDDVINENKYVATLEPQRIRSFIIQYQN